MKTLTTLTLFLSVFFCQAQDGSTVKTYFIKGDRLSSGFFGVKVNSSDSADYIRTVGRQKNNENMYDVNEYYLDKTTRRIGNSLTDGFAPKYNGNVISYYKNGSKAAEELYISGKLSGVSTYYFANKQLEKRVLYGQNKSTQTEKVLEFNDSLGNAFLDETGTGSFKVTDENGDLTEGTYTKGLKDKIWKTTNVKKNETYFDEYDAGKYVKGKTIDSDGKTTSYDVQDALPTFKGGLHAFGSFLSSNLRYPNEARDANVQGRVFIQFVVEKDGSLVDTKVIRGIGSGCDEEALRVINKSPKWNPGTQRGKPVRVSYTVPIFFQLAPARPKSSLEKPSSDSFRF